MVSVSGSQSVEKPVFTLKFQWFRSRKLNAVDALAENELL